MENTRGQNGQKKRKMHSLEDSQHTNFERDRQRSTTRGLTDMDAEPSAGKRGATRGYRTAGRSSIMDSYFDGRLSDE